MKIPDKVRSPVSGLEHGQHERRGTAIHPVAVRGGAQLAEEQLRDCGQEGDA